MMPARGTMLDVGHPTGTICGGGRGHSDYTNWTAVTLQPLLPRPSTRDVRKVSFDSFIISSFLFLSFYDFTCTTPGSCRDCVLSVVKAENPVCDFLCYFLRSPPKSRVWSYLVDFGLLALARAWPEWPSSHSPTLAQGDAATWSRSGSMAPTVVPT